MKVIFNQLQYAGWHRPWSKIIQIIRKICQCVDLVCPPQPPMNDVRRQTYISFFSVTVQVIPPPKPLDSALKLFFAAMPDPQFSARHYNFKVAIITAKPPINHLP
jgi:hypothetical protein